MVGAVVAGRGVGKDGEASAVDRESSRDLAEAFGRNGHLARAARVRPDRARMEMTERHPEPRLDLAPQRLRFTKLVGVEIDMGVEIIYLGQANSPAVALILGRRAIDQGATTLFPPLAVTSEKRISASSNT